MSKHAKLKLYIIVSLCLSGLFLTGPNPIAFPPLAILLGVWLFADRMRVKIDAIIYFVIFLFVSSLFVGWPLTCVGGIYGRVINESTNVPVNNAIFEITGWANSFGLLGGGSHETFKKYVVTDNAGHYRIKRQWSFNYLFFNSSLPQVKVRHPLYMPASLDYTVPFSGMQKGAFGDFFRHKFSDVNYDIHLVSLSDQYRDNRGNGTGDIETVLRFEVIPYVYQAKALNVTMNWEEVFSAWDEILGRFGGYKGTVRSEIEMVTFQEIK